jgi:hypothetical protein
MAILVSHSRAACLPQLLAASWNNFNRVMKPYEYIECKNKLLGLPVDHAILESMSLASSPLNPFLQLLFYTLYTSIRAVSNF